MIWQRQRALEVSIVQSFILQTKTGSLSTAFQSNFHMKSHYGNHLLKVGGKIQCGLPQMCNPQIYPGLLKSSLHSRSVTPPGLSLMSSIYLLPGKRDLPLTESLLLPHTILPHFFSNLLHFLEEISFFFHIPVSQSTPSKSDLLSQSHVPPFIQIFLFPAKSSEKAD